MKREKCALCGRPYALDDENVGEDECAGQSCWHAALNRLAEHMGPS